MARNEIESIKNDIEHQLQEMRRRYEREFNALSKDWTNQALKNSSVKEHLDTLKKKNESLESMVELLKTQIKDKERENAILTAKFQEAENQCDLYFKQWNEAKSFKEQIEAKERAKQDQERRLIDHAMSFASSSMIDHLIPPPPPVEVPSMDEFLRP